MRRATLLGLCMLVGCTRAPPGAAPAPVEHDAPPAMLPSSPGTEATRPPEATPARTRLVSHMVDGKVFIEEVPLDPEEEPAPQEPAEAGSPASGCEAARAALVAALDDGVGHRVVATARLVEGACAASDAGRAELARRLEEQAARAAPADQRSLWSAAALLEPSANRLAHLGEAADADNDGPAALDAWRRAAALAPKDAAIARELAGAERRYSVEQRFDTIAREHFSARFEGAEKAELAWDSLRLLDDAWREVGQALDVHPAAPITVVFYTGAAYEEATGAREWSAGQFDGKIRVRAGALRQGPAALRDLLFHEYVHAALETSVEGKLPAWLHEGLAQRFEPGLDRTRDLAPLQGRPRAQLPSLADLSHGFGHLTDHAQVRLYYACALDLVDELARWRGERSFAELLAAMRGGQSFEQALDRVYGLDAQLLQDRWQSRH